MAHFDSLLLEFGNLVNIPDLAVDHLGVCMLKIDDIEVLLQYRSATETLLVRATLGAIPPDVLEKVGEDAVYKRLLKANSFLYETEGFALGIDDPVEVISLYRIYDVRSTSMSFDDFELALSDCMNVAEKWVEYVQNFVRFMDEGASDVEIDPNDKLIQQAASMSSSLENTAQQPEQPAMPTPQQQAAPATAQQTMSAPPRPAGTPPPGVPPRPAPGAPSGVPPRPATPPSMGAPAGAPPRPAGTPPSGVPPRPAPGAPSGVPPRPATPPSMGAPAGAPPRPAGTPPNAPPPPPGVPPKK